MFELVERTDLRLNKPKYRGTGIVWKRSHMSETMRSLNIKACRTTACQATREAARLFVLPTPTLEEIHLTPYPECALDQRDKPTLILPDSVDEFSLRGVIAHEMCHLVVMPPERAERTLWADEMIAQVFALCFTRSHGGDPFDRFEPSDFSARDVREMDMLSLRSHPKRSSFYARAMEMGVEVLFLAGWPAMISLARELSRVEPDLERWIHGVSNRSKVQAAPGLKHSA